MKNKQSCYDDNSCASTFNKKIKKIKDLGVGGDTDAALIGDHTRRMMDFLFNKNPRDPRSYNPHTGKPHYTPYETAPLEHGKTASDYLGFLKTFGVKDSADINAKNQETWKDNQVINAEKHQEGINQASEDSPEQREEFDSGQQFDQNMRTEMNHPIQQDLPDTDAQTLKGVQDHSMPFKNLPTDAAGLYLMNRSGSGATGVGSSDVPNTSEASGGLPEGVLPDGSLDPSHPYSDDAALAMQRRHLEEEAADQSHANDLDHLFSGMEDKPGVKNYGARTFADGAANRNAEAKKFFAQQAIAKKAAEGSAKKTAEKAAEQAGKRLGKKLLEDGSEAALCLSSGGGIRRRRVQKNSGGRSHEEEHDSDHEEGHPMSQVRNHHPSIEINDYRHHGDEDHSLEEILLAIAESGHAGTLFSPSSVAPAIHSKVRSVRKNIQDNLSDYFGGLKKSVMGKGSDLVSQVKSKLPESIPNPLKKNRKPPEISIEYSNRNADESNISGSQLAPGADSISERHYQPGGDERRPILKDSSLMSSIYPKSDEHSAYDEHDSHDKSSFLLHNQDFKNIRRKKEKHHEGSLRGEGSPIADGNPYSKNKLRNIGESFLSDDIYSDRE